MSALRSPSTLCVASAFSVLVALAGCAAPRTPIPNYAPPTGGPTAKLAMRGYGADVYGVFVFAENETCTQRQFAGSGRRSGEPPKSIVLPAGQWTTLDFLSYDETRKTYCRVRWSFQPTADRTYLLSGTANTTHCAARVYDATNPDDLKLESSAILRSVGNNLCLGIAEAQARKKRLADANPVASSKDEPMLAPSATTDDLKGLMKP